MTARDVTIKNCRRSFLEAARYRACATRLEAARYRACATRTGPTEERSFPVRRIQRANISGNGDHVVIGHLRNRLLHERRIAAISSAVFELMELAHNVNGMQSGDSRDVR